MNLHEYQAKRLLKKYGIPIPDFDVVSQAQDSSRVARELHLDKAVVKIQVHAGGRGKAGGVKFADNPEQIGTVASSLIGMKMVNEQTGPEGVIAKEVLIARPVDIKKEYYLGIVIDRAKARPMMIASPEGGMEIEEIAEKCSEKLLKMPVSFDGKLRSYQLLELTNFMGWKDRELAKQGAALAKGLAKAFIECDAELLEINPLVETPEGELWAVDTKLGVDDNALFRQSEIVSFYDPSQISQMEAAAKEYDLAYIAMDGDIGCMVNGAGLAMATMDIIKLEGGNPANFLDVGGGASKEKVAEGFRIILSDPKVKAVLVNIFGGIMNCATLADGILHAAKDLKIQVPLIVRMEGTNVEEGRRMIAESGLKIITAEDVTQAAQKAVEAAKKGR